MNAVVHYLIEASLLFILRDIVVVITKGTIKCSKDKFPPSAGNYYFNANKLKQIEDLSKRSRNFMDEVLICSTENPMNETEK